MHEEEFLTSATEQFKMKIDDPHARMLQRLDHEKHERGEALKKVEALRTRRDALAASVAAKRAFLTALEVCLWNVFLLNMCTPEEGLISDACSMRW